MTTDRDIGRAQALGRAAAAAGQTLDSCPYPLSERVLRLRWVLAYLGAGGRVGIETRLDKARAKVRSWWRDE